MSRPLMWVGVAYTLGVIWAAGDQKLFYGTAGIVLFVWITGRIRQPWKEKRLFWLLPVFFVSGFVIFDHAMTDVKDASMENQFIHTRGMICQSEAKEKTLAVTLSDADINGRKKKLLLYMEKEAPVAVGDDIEVCGILEKPERASNPGQFDGASYYRSKGIAYIMRPDGYTIVGKGNSYPLELGSNSFIPGYEDQLIGKKAGETVEVKTTFPADYHAKDLAGKEALFVTTIKEIREYKPAELNDEFAKSMGANDVADLKSKIEARILEDYNATSRIKLKRDLLDALDKEYSFEVPQKLIDAEYAAIEKQYQDAKAKNQLDESEKARDEKDVLAEYKEIALRRVKLGLLLSEIGADAKLQLSADDVNKAIMNEAKRYPGQEKMVLDYYVKNKEAVEALKAPAYEEKIVDYVLEKANVGDKEVSVEELYDFSDGSAKKESKAKKSA